MDMQGLASRYKTVLTLTGVLGAGTWNKIASANPMRYRIRIDAFAFVGGVVFATPPGPDTTAVVPTVSNCPRESKWSDAVSETTGEWVAFCSVGGRFLVTEIIQI
jgi:hypothetical protein